MIDLRTNTLTAIAACSLGQQAYYDFNSNDYAERAVLEGKYPVTTFIIGVGDVRVTERKSWTWGWNLVRCEVDILMFLRNHPTTTDEFGRDNKLARGMTKSHLSDADNILTCELREAEAQTQIHDNIWKRIWTLDVLMLEALP